MGIGRFEILAMILLHVVRVDEEFSSPVVFDMKDVVKLRERYNIYGILSGTLPINTQQNNFLYLPLTLSLEEAYYLVKEGVAAIASLPQGSIADKNRDYEALENNFIQTPDRIPADSEVTHNEEWLKFVEASSDIKLTYPLYRTLVTNKISVLPGARFGCKYVGYPGDPLKYHSQYLITKPVEYHSGSIDLLHLVNLTRLGTIVKKSVLVAGVTKDPAEKAESNTKLFTIEWCGFG